MVQTAQKKYPEAVFEHLSFAQKCHGSVKYDTNLFNGSLQVLVAKCIQVFVSNLHDS